MRSEFGTGVEGLVALDFLPASFKLSLRRDIPADRIEVVAAEIEEWIGVENIKYNASLLQLLETNLRTLTRMGAIIGLLVLITAMLLVFNTIRLTVYARRDVIKAMKLVGATNRFIRAPFVIEGILQGFLAGGISVSVLHLCFERLLPKLTPEFDLMVWPFGQWYYLIGAMVTLSVLLGWLGATLSIATVYATSMIYAQLKTVPRWNTPLTCVLFIILALTGGAILTSNVEMALLLLICSGVVQVAYWVSGDQAFIKGGTTLATATGLGRKGVVRAFEPPHTGTNYLLREFVHLVGRKHASKLRMISLILMVGTPIVIFSIAVTPITAFIAIIAHIIGLFISRWLFFAQAEHVVGLYYGKR